MRNTRKIVVIFIIWFAAACLAGVTGLVEHLKPPFPQLIIISITAILLISGFKIKSFREFLLNLDWRFIVGLHLVRYIGFHFIKLFMREELPFEFAVIGGIGDIVIAYTATMILVFYKRIGSKVLLIWNLLGLAEILFVVFTAARIGIKDPQSMAALLKMPLSLLPTFVVPVIITSHILLLIRIRSKRGIPGVVKTPG